MVCDADLELNNGTDTFPLPSCLDDISCEDARFPLLKDDYSPRRSQKKSYAEVDKGRDKEDINLTCLHPFCHELGNNKRQGDVDDVCNLQEEKTINIDTLCSEEKTLGSWDLSDFILFNIQGSPS
jgi:hypothetical protein